MVVLDHGYAINLCERLLYLVLVLVTIDVPRIRNTMFALLTGTFGDSLALAVLATFDER